jgi:hypothetical protein
MRVVVVDVRVMRMSDKRAPVFAGAVLLWNGIPVQAIL